MASWKRSKHSKHPPEARTTVSLVLIEPKSMFLVEWILQLYLLKYFLKYKEVIKKED